MLSNIVYSSNVSDDLDESIERIVSGLLLIQVSSECRIEQHAKFGSSAESVCGLIIFGCIVKSYPILVYVSTCLAE